MECPDPVPWAAILGVLGTLAASVLGYRFATKQAREQREHADRVRFHDTRAKVYADFTGACGMLRAVRNGLRQQPDAELHPETVRLRTAGNEALRTSLGQIDLLASPATRDAARGLFDYIMRTCVYGEVVEPDDREGHTLTLAFEAAARKELSTDG